MNLAERRTAYVRKLEEAARTAVATLSQLPGVERVSLVGSYARGRDLQTWKVPGLAIPEPVLLRAGASIPSLPQAVGRPRGPSRRGRLARYHTGRSAQWP